MYLKFGRDKKVTPLHVGRIISLNFCSSIPGPFFLLIGDVKDGRLIKQLSVCAKLTFYQGIVFRQPLPLNCCWPAADCIVSYRTVNFARKITP